MNKKLLKDQLANLNIKTPRGIYVEDWGDNEDREETVAGVVATISKKLSPPWNIEPISKGLGNGGIIAKTRDELTTILSQMFELKTPTLIEEVVLGKEVSVSTVSDFRGESQYTFLPTQLDNFHAKLHPKESESLQKLAKGIHKNMHLGHYSRVEAVISPKGNIYVKNIETIPVLHKESDFNV